MLGHAMVNSISQVSTIGKINSRLEISSKYVILGEKKYGGADISIAKRMKKLESRSFRLKKEVAELKLDKLMLKKALDGNLKLRSASSVH